MTSDEVREMSDDDLWIWTIFFMNLMILMMTIFDEEGFYIF